MKCWLCSLLCLALASSSQAFPQGYGSDNTDDVETGLKHSEAPLDPNCKVEFKVVQDIAYVEEVKDVCLPKFRNICMTIFKKECTPYEDKECHTEVKEHCETKLNKNCYDDFKDVAERFTEDECLDEMVKVCDKHWVEIGYNEKVWEDDPTTCKELTKTECKPVEKIRNTKEKFTKCDDVPVKECKDIPEEKCDVVTKEKCQEVPYDECKDEEVQECKPVHSKTPQQVSKRVPIKICKDQHGIYPDLSSINDVEIVDPRQGTELDLRTTNLKNTELLGDAQETANNAQQEDDDRIHFFE